MRRPLLGTLLGLALALVTVSPAWGGGSAETTLVVINAHSPLSQRIANEYQQLRGIPDTHLLRLSGVPSFGTLSVADFRRKVLQPIREYLREHGLEEEIDLIAYSGDFPYAVNFAADVKADKLPRNHYRGSHGSLTGLTYFANRVEARDTGYLGANHYFRDFAGPHKRRVRSAVAVAPLSEKEAKRLRNEAAKALKRKDYVTAAAHYRKVLASYPAAPELWYDLARTQAAAGELAQALETLATAVDNGWTQSLRTRRDSAFEPLREDQRFAQLVERMANAYGPFQLSHGFRHYYVWSNVDLRSWEPDDALDQYYLSTMLAYTGVRGNSLPEVLDYLRSAAASDGSAPEGTVYLLENGNVRSETRQPLFPATVAQLALRGRKAEILSAGRDGQDGIVPRNRDDVIGAVVGTQGFRWEKANSRLLPGAIAESLTSYGGHFNKGKQTKLTAFLRHGAAGSSGAVAEPYSFQEKFPVPLIHAYYADGCSLAEAFYQSILAPYQLIIVGDPLARPFAKFADVALASPDPRESWAGVVAIEPSVRPAEGTSIEAVELWVDGQRLASAAPGEKIHWDTGAVDDGRHELRLVAVEAGTIETRSSFTAQIEVFNHDRRIDIVAAPSQVREGDRIQIRGRADGAAIVELRRGNEVLAEARPTDGIWELTAPARLLGIGEVVVYVRAQYPNGQAVRSRPLALAVGEPALLPAALLDRPVGKGLKAVVHYADGESDDLVVDRLVGRLRALGKKGRSVQRIELSGFLQVKVSGFYQLAARAEGRLTVALHDELRLAETLTKGGPEVFLPLGLEAGWHPIKITLEPDRGTPSLQLVLAGAEVPVALDKDNLAHREDDATPPVAVSEP